MVGLKEKIHYKSTNLVPSLDQWNMYLARDTGSATIEIQPGGYISTTYNVVNKKPGKKPSKYRRYIIDYYIINMDQSFDYSDKFALYEKLTNITGDTSDEYTQSYNVIPLTYTGNTDVPGETPIGPPPIIQTHKRKKIVVEALNSKITTSEIRIENNSNVNMVVDNVKIQRSNDTWGQQSEPQDYITTDGGVHFIDDSQQYETPLVYTVPVMSLNDWNAYDKALCNEAIILGSSPGPTPVPDIVVSGYNYQPWNGVDYQIDEFNIINNSSAAISSCTLEVTYDQNLPASGCYTDIYTVVTVNNNIMTINVNYNIQSSANTTFHLFIPKNTYNPVYQITSVICTSVTPAS